MGFGTPKVGAEKTVSVATVTPVWNTATTAGSLGLAFVLANNTGTVGGPAGWTAITANNISQFTLWYKESLSASEANPTFTSTSASVMKAYMVEVPVTGGTAAIDQSGTGTSTSSPVTATNGAADATATDIAVAGSAWRNNANTTGTISYTAGYTNLLNDGSSSSTAHIAGCYQIFTAGGVTADSVATSFTGSVKDAASSIASFKIAGTTFTQALSVTSTTSPALVRQAGKVLGVTSTTSPTLTKLIGKAISLTTTTGPSLLKRTGKLLSLTSTTSPVLTAGKVIVQVLGVTTTTAATLIKQAQKLLGVTSTTTPSLSKQIGKRVAVTSTTTPKLVKQAAKIVAVTTTTTPLIVRRVGKVFAVTTTTTATLVKQVGKLVSVVTTTAPTLAAIKLGGIVNRITLAVTTTTSAVMAAVYQSAPSPTTTDPVAGVGVGAGLSSRYGKPSFLVPMMPPPVKVTRVPDWLIESYLRGDIDEEEFTLLVALQ